MIFKSSLEQDANEMSGKTKIGISGVAGLSAGV